MTHEKQMELAKCAILRHVVLRSWTGRGQDKELTQQLARDRNVTAADVKVDKNRVAKKYLDPITQQDGKIRAIHRRLTLPWSDEGMRVLPTRMLEQWDEKVIPELNVRDNRVAEFISNWDEIVDEARHRLKSMFREEDYPSVSKLRRRFSYSISSQPFPTENDFRVDLNQANLDRIKRGLEENIRNSLRDSTQELWNRLYAVVNHVATRWSEDGKVYDSAIGNINEVVELLPALNLANDPALNELTDEVRKRLSSVNVECVRGNKSTKKAIAQDAKRLAAKIAKARDAQDMATTAEEEPPTPVTDDTEDEFVMDAEG